MDLFNEAIDCYTKEIALNGQNIRTLNNRAYSYAKLSKYKEAIADYKFVI